MSTRSAAGEPPAAAEATVTSTGTPAADEQPPAPPAPTDVPPPTGMDFLPWPPPCWRPATIRKRSSREKWTGSTRATCTGAPLTRTPTAPPRRQVRRAKSPTTRLVTTLKRATKAKSLIVPLRRSRKREIEEGAGIEPAPPDLSGFDEEEDAVEESKAEKEEYKDLGGYSVTDGLCDFDSQESFETLEALRMRQMSSQTYGVRARAQELGYGSDPTEGGLRPAAVRPPAQVNLDERRTLFHLRRPSASPTLTCSYSGMSCTRAQPAARCGQLLQQGPPCEAAVQLRADAGQEARRQDPRRAP